MEKRRIIWLPQAIENVKEHCSFLAEVSEKKADELFETFFAVADRLVTHPLIGAKEPSLQDLREEYRYLVVRGTYKIIYEVTKQNVFIHSVWDCRRNPLELDYP